MPENTTAATSDLSAQGIVRKWNYRYAELDRAPHPESFLHLEEEQVLVRAIDSLAARLDRAERARVKAEADYAEQVTENERLRRALERISAAPTTPLSYREPGWSYAATPAYMKHLADSALRGEFADA